MEWNSEEPSQLPSTPNLMNTEDGGEYMTQDLDKG